jgi:two-component system, OmpR family, response regulator
MPTQIPQHILIVDPDLSAAHVTRAIVARAAPDALVTVEPDAGRACRELAQIRPGVLIIDPSPSPLAGAQLIAAVKGQPAGQVIVAASAPTVGLRRRMHALGVDLYLEKPSPLLVGDLRSFLNGAP